MKKSLSFFFLAALLVSGGCTSTSTGLSPSTTPITGKDAYTVTGKKVSAGTYGVSLIGIPFGRTSPSKKATEYAIEKGGGNALIEVSETLKMLNLLYVQIYWTRVDGTPVKVERGGAN